MRLKTAALVGVLLAATVLAFILIRWAIRERAAAAPEVWTAETRTLAGSGVAGVQDHADPLRARFSDPFGVAVDAEGHVFVADAGEAQRIRRISRDGGVVSVAGGSTGFADGHGEAARFNTPSGIVLSADGALLVADTGNNAIRRVTREGRVSTVAGDGTSGFADGPAGTARFNGPIGITVDAAQRVIVADTYNDRIRAIEPNGHVVTLAGDGQPGNQDGPAAAARFNTPCGVTTDADGNIYVADTGNDAIRVISKTGVSTLWTSLPEGLFRPTGIVATAGGVLYVSDERGAIVEIRRDSAARVLAGSRPGFVDGIGAEARFRAPSGIAIAGARRFVVADRRNAAIRSLAAPSEFALRARPPSPTMLFAPQRPPAAPLLWPFAPFEGPHEITGTLGEARGAESERLHAGLDVHAVEGTAVHTVRSGFVLDPIASTATGTLVESIRIGPLTYVHLRVGRERRDEPFADDRFVHAYDDEHQLAQTRVKRGSRFRAGEPIGTVNRFSHVHLNVGWPGEEINALNDGLVQFQDTVAPTIARGGIRVFGEDGQPFTGRVKRRLLINGRVRIVVDAWDQVNGNARRRRLGLYRLGYQVLNHDGTPVAGFESPLETIRFDRLAPERDAARLVYWSGSGIPEYGRRSTQFLYVVTNTLRGGVASEGVWDTSALPAGDYIVRVLAADSSGNEAIANRDLAVTIGSAATAASR